MTQVRDLMSTEVEVCSLLDNIFEVAVKMKEENVGSIPIIDNERLVGMITDRDIVLRCIAEKKPPSSKVEEIMSSNLISIKPEIDTREATELMAKHQIRRLPVVEEGKLLGIVALGDFAVRQLTDEQAQAALTEISEPSGDNHLSH
ncbi:CBS domain-containing protein [Bacillus sp. FSL K6-3431]|uniref:CBS domain-containing protein n=1 Tax=Bacillus sp. FSL K6-3431 TaxID=2921500 RepID=UPI0030F5B2C1